MKYTEENIFKAFDDEGFKIVDQKQIDELRRWALLDFKEHQDDQFVSDRAPIIVCGCGRSGTTLTRVILDTNPSIYSGAESLLFLPTDIDFDDLSFKFEVNKQELETLYDESASRAEFIEKFQDRVLEDNGKAIWADKTARNAHVLPYILEHFPNAKIVHVIRNPRDVVASLKTHKKRKKSEGKIENTGYTMPVSLAIKRWNGVMEDMLPFREYPNYTEVHYEDLVLNTEETVKDLCDFLGVEYQEEMLNFHEVTGSTRDYNKFIQNIEATKPLSQTSVGRHERILTDGERQKVDIETAHYAKIYGYQSPDSQNQLKPKLG